MKNSKIFTETFEVEDHEFKESFIDSKGETWSATCDAEIEFSTNHWESLSARDDEMEVNVYSSKISNLVLLNGEEEKKEDQIPLEATKFFTKAFTLIQEDFCDDISQMIYDRGGSGAAEDDDYNEDED